MGNYVEIGSLIIGMLRDLDPKVIAQNTDGVLESRDNLWVIGYRQGYIHLAWTEAPNPESVSQAVSIPALYVREPRPFAESLHGNAAILTAVSLVVIKSDSTHNYTPGRIYGYNFSEGNFFEFTLALEDSPVSKIVWPVLRELSLLPELIGRRASR